MLDKEERCDTGWETSCSKVRLFGGSGEDIDDDEDEDRPPCFEEVLVAGEAADKVVDGDGQRAPEEVGTA